MWETIKVYVIGALFVGLLAAAIIGYMKIRSALIEKGRQEIQHLWAADKAEIQAQTIAKQESDARIIKEALERNAKEREEYEHKVADSKSVGDLMARRLHDAETKLAAIRASRPADSDRQGTPPPSREEVFLPSPGLLGAAFSECLRNADRLDALNGELGPQLDEVRPRNSPIPRTSFPLSLRNRQDQLAADLSFN